MNVDEALLTLKSKYLITDLSSLSAKDAELMSEHTQIDDLLNTGHLFEIGFYNNNDKSLLVNFYSKIKNVQYEITCPITKYGKDIHIQIPKYLIRRNIYNTFSDKNMYVTSGNMKFIEKLKYLYNVKDMMEYFKLYGYTIEKKCLFIINKSQNTINIEYIEKYNLYLNMNINSKEKFYLTNSKRNDFSHGISQELDKALTQKLFGKDFNKLNTKELEILKAYLY